MADRAIRELLGGQSATAFVRKYWQKRPLLVRDALAGFKGLLSRPQLFALAGRDDVESRLIRYVRGKRTLAQGPFRAAELQALPAREWTLLVQGVNLHVAAADALLRRFAFIPYTRLDDVMVSYAAPGGGVGPHVDSYDVFLLQGEGRRRWQIAGPSSYGFGSRHPSRAPMVESSHQIELPGFRPEVQCTLDAGDMLYLPPRYAHDGVALEACTTYSIGFRAPSAQELGTAFLDWLRDSIALKGRYADASLAATTQPALIDRSMQRRCAAMLAGIRWNEAAVSRFLGCYLSEPKPSVFFEPPPRPLRLDAFHKAAVRRGVRLDPRTQLLYDTRNVFLNGSRLDYDPKVVAVIKRLANDRRLRGADLSAAHSRFAAAMAQFHRWYRDGFLHLG